MVKNNFCVLCGAPQEEGAVCEHKFKKMCLNCASLGTNEKGELVCVNEKNLMTALEKVKSAVPQGFALDELKLSPIPLKKTTARCGEWVISTETFEYVMSLFE